MNRVEKIVAKGAIAHYQLFLLLPECFQKPDDADTSKSKVGKG